jgi:hypothetical protein
MIARVARVAAQAVSVGVAMALALGAVAMGHHAATVAGHATIAPPHWTDGVAVCMAEDGSTPGQTFPCRWDATYQGNGLGESFTLTGSN